jgi:hypothetical protein
MRVYLGPYRHRWISTVHANYMDKKYNHDWNDNQNVFEHTLEKFEDGLQGFYNLTINKILDKRNDRKIKIHIDNYDIWSMDDTLALIISPMLKKLKEHKHGSSYVDNEDVPPELQHPVTDDPEHDSLIEKRWNYVLDEMLWAFDQKTRDWESEFYVYENDPKAFLGLRFVRNDIEGIKKHHDRMKNGFRLFGKYYEALWN